MFPPTDPATDPTKPTPTVKRPGEQPHQKPDDAQGNPSPKQRPDGVPAGAPDSDRVGPPPAKK